MRYLKTFESKVYVSKTFVTVDAVIVKENTQELLLIKRKNEPYKGHWALPGGFLDENEDLEKGAIRELKEETGIVVNSMEQVGAFGKPGRDPRGHMVGVAYFSLVDDDAMPIADDDADDVDWFKLDSLPQMAFDHKDIIDTTVKRFIS